uniref:Uncharacterized protein n=1 Tax=Arundo donax TaxID=35708 RepID=A0A0A9PUQ1_ARUDO
MQLKSLYRAIRYKFQIYMSWTCLLTFSSLNSNNNTGVKDLIRAQCQEGHKQGYAPKSKRW